MVVAIDGPAGVGKSTISKMIADKLGIYYLNSGNFYRAITLKAINEGTDLKDPEACRKVAEKAEFDVVNGRFHLDGKDVEDLLHTPQIDLNASYISVNPDVRSIVNKRIHELTSRLSIVAEGRDMTTVVFPDAEYRFFFDAKPEVRAKRRFDQNPSAMPYEKVLAEIIERDENDRNKPVGALKLAEGVTYVDTSYLTIKEVCDKVLNCINK